MLKSTVQSKILNTLPDNRPITSITIIENLDKCPTGFYPISRTYDQDQEADLRESSIFKIGSSRYLCLSKTEGIPNFVVQELLILHDKGNPPKGFSLLARTADSEQKPWKKKQICYRLVNRKDTTEAVTDIILCSRLKKAPLGFTFAGELNGITVCFKMGNAQDTEATGRNGNSAPTPREIPPRATNVSPMYPTLGTDSDNDYEILLPPTGPSRPAPKPPIPPMPHQNSTHTLSSSAMGLEGVPFVVNPRFLSSNSSDRPQYPIIKAKTMQQLLKDYDYPFTVERQT